MGNKAGKDDEILAMGWIKGLEIVVLSLLLVLLVIGLLGLYLGAITSKTIMDPSFFKDILDKEDAYSQIRQSMFRLINKSLPNGRDSMPYLEEAITETWLKDEIESLISGFYAFAKGYRSSPPTIPIGKLKDKVIRDMDEGRSLKERTKIVQFWFDPLPDEVRLEDFMAIDTLWGFRNLNRILKLFLFMMAGLCILTLVLIRLMTKDWAFTFLWFGSGLIVAGSLLFLPISLTKWLLGRMTIVQNTLSAILHIGVSQANVYNFLWAFVDGLIGSMKVMALVSFLAGGAIIYIIPIKDIAPIIRG